MAVTIAAALTGARLADNLLAAQKAHLPQFA